MADHGQVVASRTYWLTTGADGKQVVVDQPPGGSGGFLGTGIGGKSAPPSTQYQEQTFEDGTRIVSRWDPEGNTWKQESVEVDTGLAAQHKAGTASAAGAPETREFPDGSLRQWNRATGQWEKIADAAPPKAPAPGQTVTRVNPQTGQTEIVSATQAAEERATRQEKRQLTLDEIQAHREEMDQQIKMGQLSATQAEKEHTRWYQTRLLEHQQAQDALANQRENRIAASQERQAELSGRREDRLAAAQERQMTIQESQQERLLKQQEQNLGFNQQQAALNYGQNRVQNVLSTMPYRVGPGFAQSFAQGLSTLSGGGGPVSFNPADFQVQIPNQDALAEEGFRRAMAVFGVTPPPAVLPNAPGGPLPLPPGYPSMPR